VSEGSAGHAEASGMLAPVPEKGPPRAVPEPVRGGAVELSARALVAGGLVGGVLALTNLYAGLKTGFWESGCVLSSLLSFGGMSAFTAWRQGPPSPLETNLSQTMAVSVGAVPASAGLLGAIPALALLGTEAPGVAVALWGMGLGALGVLLAFSLRRRLLEEEALPFATGAATAEFISTLHATGASPGRRARALGASSLGAMLLTWAREARGLPGAWLPAEQVVVGGVPAQMLLLGVGWSPLLLGIGMLTGLRSGLSVLVGGGVAWVGLAPGLVREGLVARAEYAALAAWLLWPGLGLMVGAAATTLAAQVRALPEVGRDVARLGRQMAWAVPAVVLVTLLVGLFAFELRPVHLLLALLLAVPLSAVCARATGQTDIAPISPVGQLGQLGLGMVTPGLPALNVAAGSVVSGTASHLSGSLWSLQAGRWLGASPSRQFLVQLWGLLLGCAVAVPAYSLLVTAHGLATPELPMPVALQFKAVAELTSRGLEGLPPGAAGASAVAFGVGVLLSVGARGRLARVLPSAAAMGIGFLLPAYYSVTLCLGALLVAGVRRLRPSAEAATQAAGAGALVGESLLGIVLAALLALGLMRPPG
jgi:uncharacterized oligopeptide transporter (OPT) family protein